MAAELNLGPITDEQASDALAAVSTKIEERVTTERRGKEVFLCIDGPETLLIEVHRALHEFRAKIANSLRGLDEKVSQKRPAGRMLTADEVFPEYNTSGPELVGPDVPMVDPMFDEYELPLHLQSLRRTS